MLGLCQFVTICALRFNYKTRYKGIRIPTFVEKASFLKAVNSGQDRVITDKKECQPCNQDP
jgi:hypothetical protein